MMSKLFKTLQSSHSHVGCVSTLVLSIWHHFFGLLECRPWKMISSFFKFVCIFFPVKSKLCWSASRSAGVFKESNGRKEGPSRVGVSTLYNMLFSLNKDMVIKQFSYIVICLPILLYYLYLKGILDWEHFNQIDVLRSTPARVGIQFSVACRWTVGPTTKSMSLTLLEVRAVWVHWGWSSLVSPLPPLTDAIIWTGTRSFKKHCQVSAQSYIYSSINFYEDLNFSCGTSVA